MDFKCIINSKVEAPPPALEKAIIAPAHLTAKSWEESLLHYAEDTEHMKLVNEIIARFDADVKFKDRNGQTLLHLTAKLEEPKSFETKNRGTPLIVAVDAE